MKIIDIQKKYSNELASKEAAIALLKDGLVAFPTDTLYGFGVNALNSDAVNNLFKVKKSPLTRPIPLMVSSVEMAKALAFIDKGREGVLNALWPGPYTFVLWKRKIVPSSISAGTETVALRIPAHPLCQMILRDFEGPVTATSANISGEEPLTGGKDIIKRFEKEEFRPNLIIDAGYLPGRSASAVIDLTGEEPKILRVNPTTKDELMKVFKAIGA